MGGDKIRHLLVKTLAGGEAAYFWNPSKTIRALGLVAEPLGRDYGLACTRAAELNKLADEARRGSGESFNGPRPGTFSKLKVDYLSSPEYRDLKPRTQRDYAYYLDKIELEFGHLPVLALTPPVIKTYYHRERERGTAWGYHILSHLRTVLSWGAEEGWLPENPALLVRMKAPPKRTVTWSPEQASTYIAKAAELGWHSIVAMVHVFDSIGQSPVDVRTLLRKSYDGRAIDVTRAKTGRTDAPIALFPAGRKALDAYLKSQPSKLPDAPLFTHDKIGGMWNENTLQQRHRDIRRAAKLPENLQLQDFRTTAQTEGGAASGTVDELRALGRHASRSAGEHYVFPNADYVDSIQEKRLAHRNKKRQKVRMKIGKSQNSRRPHSSAG